MKTEYEIRKQEWADNYESFEGDDVRDLIILAGERLAAICLDEEAVSTVMKGLYRALGMPDNSQYQNADVTWRELWQEADSGDALDLNLSQHFVSLNAYAYYGVSLDYHGGLCSIEDIRRLVEEVMKAVGMGASDQLETAEIDSTILAAQARLALDEGNTVTPNQLAAISRVGLKTVRNAMAPSSGSSLKGENGVISAESARKWLEEREDFKTSIWRNATPFTPKDETVKPIEGDLIWVPFAKDNSEFDPVVCLRGDTYTIGLKNSERKFSDYREALDHLARMQPSAYWRRPNSSGNWGIVTSVGFRPRTTAQLDLLNEEVVVK